MHGATIPERSRESESWRQRPCYWRQVTQLSANTVRCRFQPLISACDGPSGGTGMLGVQVPFPACALRRLALTQRVSGQDRKDPRMQGHGNMLCEEHAACPRCAVLSARACCCKLSGTDAAWHMLQDSGQTSSTPTTLPRVRCQPTSPTRIRSTASLTLSPALVRVSPRSRQLFFTRCYSRAAL